MSLPRYTIRSLLLLVLFIGVSFAGLRASNDAWDAGIFGLTLSVLLSAVLLAVHRSDRKRASWLGFALFGWAYLAATLILPVESRLPTTKGVAYLDSMILRGTPVGEFFADIDHDGQLDHFVVDSSSPTILDQNQGNGIFTDVTNIRAAGSNGPQFSGDVIIRSTTKSWLFRGTATTENFLRIGHSLLALVVGFAGGFLSRWMYDREDLGTQVSGNRP